MAQADRAPPPEGGDRRFESCWEHDARLAGAGGGPQTVVARFDPGVRLRGPWSNGQGNCLLSGGCAFDSRRADRVLTLWTVGGKPVSGTPATPCPASPGHWRGIACR